MSTFSVFVHVVYKLAFSKDVSIFVSECFVFGHLFPDISIKSTKLLPRAGKNFSPTIWLFFCKMTAEVSRNNCAMLPGGLLFVISSVRFNLFL